MHYYNFNVADYLKHTFGLKPLEHYIYRFLIDLYFLEEKPIPKKTQLVIARLGLESEHEPMLSKVLAMFFEETDEGYVNAEIEAAIAHYKSKSVTNSVNGKLGGRPKKQEVTAKEKAKKTQPLSTGKRTKSESKPNQELITNNQELITNNQKDISEEQKAYAMPTADFVDYYPDIDKLRSMYPSHNVLVELDKMINWLCADDKNLKKPRGMANFIHNWMGKAAPTPTLVETPKKFFRELEGIQALAT